jgi:hypothetical protein
MYSSHPNYGAPPGGYPPYAQTPQPSISFDFNDVTPYSSQHPHHAPPNYGPPQSYAPSYGPAPGFAPPPSGYPPNYGYGGGGYPPPGPPMQPFGTQSNLFYPTAGPSSYGHAPVVSVAAPAIYTAPGTFQTQYLPVGGQQYVFQFKGHRLDRKDVFSQSDPFLLISAPREGSSKLKKNAHKFAKQAKSRKRFDKVRGKWSTVYRSETIRNDQNPTWRPFNVSLQTLCRNNLDIPFLIECWDADRNGNHDFIGRVMTTLRELQVMREIQLVNKHRFGFGAVAGMLEVLQCHPV